MCLKNATKRNKVNAEKIVVQTRICPASSLSPPIWSAIAMLATASGVAYKAKRAAYSAGQKCGKPKTGGKKMHITSPIAGATINLAKVLIMIFGKSFLTAEN